MKAFLKLKSAGVSGSLLTWFSDYPNYRKQRVVLPGASSSWTSVKAGVPQGSILGLLLFFYISMTLLKTLTLLLDFLLTMLACISLSMTPFRLLNS